MGWGRRRRAGPLVALERMLDRALVAANDNGFRQDLAGRAQSWSAMRQALADHRAPYDVLGLLEPASIDIYADSASVDRVLCMHLADALGLSDHALQPSHHLALAHTFAAAGRTGAAIGVTTRFLANATMPIEALGLLARLWCRAGNTPNALAAARTVLTVDPDNLAALMIEAKSEPDRANGVAMLDRIEDRHGASWALLWERANARSDTGDHHGAIAEIEEAWKLAPGQSVLLLARANFAYLAGRPDEFQNDTNRAMVAIDRWLRLAPDDWCLRMQKVRSTWALRGWQEAVDEANRFVKARPDVAVAWAERANLHAAARNHSLAAGDYSRALQLQPDSPAFLARRGVALAYVGDLDAAAADLTAAQQIDPDCGRHIHAAAGAHFRIGRPDAARELVAQALDDHPADSELLYGMACEVAEFGDGNLALDLLDNALAGTSDRAGLVLRARAEPAWSAIRADTVMGHRFEQLAPPTTASKVFRDLALWLANLPTDRRSIVAAAVVAAFVFLVVVIGRL